MQIHFHDKSYVLDEIKSGKINPKNLTESERVIIKFVMEWTNDVNIFEFFTSGSTGKPQKINLTRNQLQYSAETTLQYLFGVNKPKTLLLCIDPRFIGGRQIITRTLLSEAQLYVVNPTSNPLKLLNQNFDLASFVPLQIENILKENPEKFNLIRKVLIGGADLNPSLINELKRFPQTRFFQTYGMTETASNIAIKPIGDQYFEAIGDVNLQKNDNNELTIQGTVTNHTKLITSDIVEFHKQKFKWIGRSDFTINSGGIKHQPEKIEAKLKSQYPSKSLVVSSISDESLGEKLVLVTNSPLLKKICKSNLLSKYETPKEEFILPELPKLASGKLDRNKLKNIIHAATNTSG